MTPRTVRRIVIAVCVAGIGGMIASSIADNNGAALTAGLVTAVAVLCLIVATAVTGGGLGPAPPGHLDPPGQLDELGAEIERGIEALVDAGADEQQVREVIGAAVRFGRTRG